VLGGGMGDVSGGRDWADVGGGDHGFHGVKAEVGVM